MLQRNLLMTGLKINQKSADYKPLRWRGRLMTALFSDLKWSGDPLSVSGGGSAIPTSPTADPRQVNGP